MKSQRHSQLPLTGTDIAKSKDLLIALVDGVTSLSMPYKEEVTFVSAMSDIAIIERYGVRLWINKRYCYFNPHNCNTGDKVFIDNRYLQEVI